MREPHFDPRDTIPLRQIARDLGLDRCTVLRWAWRGQRGPDGRLVRLRTTGKPKRTTWAAVVAYWAATGRSPETGERTGQRCPRSPARRDPIDVKAELQRLGLAPVSNNMIGAAND